MTAWYNKYVNLPFKHLGDTVEKGFDCFNLCRYVYKQELGIDIPYATYDFCNIAEDDWYLKTSIQLLENATTLNQDNFKWEKVSTPKPFDILLLSMGSTNITNHCALYLEDNKLLQIMVDRKSWISPYGNYYKQYTTGIYRWAV